MRRQCAKGMPRAAHAAAALRSWNGGDKPYFVHRHPTRAQNVSRSRGSAVVTAGRPGFGPKRDSSHFPLACGSISALPAGTVRLDWIGSGRGAAASRLGAGKAVSPWLARSATGGAAGGVLAGAGEADPCIFMILCVIIEFCVHHEEASMVFFAHWGEREGSLLPY